MGWGVEDMPTGSTHGNHQLAKGFPQGTNHSSETRNYTMGVSPGINVLVFEAEVVTL